MLKYNVTPRFHWYVKSKTFVLTFDNWTCIYRDVTLGMEYQAWKHVALGVGLVSNVLEIEEDDPEYQLKFDNTATGGLLYLETNFYGTTSRGHFAGLGRAFHSTSGTVDI